MDHPPAAADHDARGGWFDGHLDLAYLAETGRDMHADPADARGRHQPVAVTLPALRGAGVRACLATVFTQAVEDTAAPDAETGAFAYPAGNALAARAAGLRQLKLYHAWAQARVIRLVRAGEAFDAEPGGPLAVGVLLEGADPIERPETLLDDEHDEWEGLLAAGLTWATRGRYACGNAVPSADADAGLTDLGRALVHALDTRGIVHDLSHLNDRSADELLAMTDRPVIASHSNARALMEPGSQRHLRDETIREIARRGGVVGINLFSPFLRPGLREGERARLADAARHAEHVAQAAGGRAHVALGSDADGGFGADRLPAEIATLADLGRLAEALRDVGWSDEEVEGFRFRNWARFWTRIRSDAPA